LSVAVNQPGIDYHVVLAQNALQHALDIPELQNELISILIKQTSRHTGQKISTGTGVQVNTKKLGKQTRVSFCFFIAFFNVKNTCVFSKDLERFLSKN
jgi:pleckstrin homology domain-containing family H